MEKKYSRVVRKLTQALIGWNLPAFLVHYPIDIVSQGSVRTEVPLADAIKWALKGETIKKSEVERLQAKAALTDLLQSKLTIENENCARLQKAEQVLEREVGMWCRFAVQYANKTSDLKDQLWAAEQEIHDLKKIVETEHQDIQKLTNWVLDLLIPLTIAGAPEQIEIPRYLKPLDALEFQYRQVAY